jgi:hypothetical protein
MMLSVCAKSMDTLSIGAESIILSAPPAESMILSTLSAVWLCYYNNSGGYKKTKIGDTDNLRFMTLINSTLTAPPVGLPPKGAKFCHTLNILLVGS